MLTLADAAMPRLLALLAALLLPLSASAAPFAVADVVPDADICIWQLDGAETRTPVTLGPPRECRLDLTNTATGPHTVRVAVENAVWGSATRSPFTSLDFVRPATLTAPASLRLAP